MTRQFLCLFFPCLSEFLSVCLFLLLVRQAYLFSMLLGGLFSTTDMYVCMCVCMCV